MNRNEFFKTIFRDCKGLVEIRAIPPVKPLFTRDPKEIRAFCEKYKDRNLYFGVATRDGNGGAKENCLYLPCIWVDIDFKNGMNKKKLDEILGKSSVQPSIIVFTGGGVHLYFLFKEPVKASEDLEKYLRAVCRHVEGDMAATDLARILRIPETRNHKRKKNVKVIHSTMRRYSLEDFEPFLEKEGGEKDKKSRSEILKGVDDGTRNNDICRYLGQVLHEYENLEYDEYWALAKAQNEKNRPPIIEKELRTKADGIWKKHFGCRPPDKGEIGEEDERELQIQLEEAAEKSENGDPLIKTYSGWAGDFAEEMSKITESPKAFYFMAALTVLGSIISDKVTMASQIAPQPRLFTLLLGESADDRKSTAIKHTIGFFRKTLNSFRVCWGVGSAEGLAQEFANHHRMLLVFDEFKMFVNKAKIEGSVLLPMVNILFENNIYQSAIKKKKIDINNGHLSILAASTVDTYSNIYTPQFIDIGFPNRVFVVKASGEKKWSIPPEMDYGEDTRLKADLGKILRMVSADVDIPDIPNSVGPPKKMEVTGKARQMFDEWYHELPRTQVAKRLDTYGLRLMMLLAVNAGKMQIDEEAVERIINLLDYEYKTREEVDPIDADGKIAVLEERIRRALVSPKNRRDLQRAVHYNRCGIFIFNAALKNLMDAGEIKYDRKSGLYFKPRS